MNVLSCQVMFNISVMFGIFMSQHLHEIHLDAFLTTMDYGTSKRFVCFIKPKFVRTFPRNIE